MKNKMLLSESLEKSWKNYEHAVHLSRKKLSPLHIHQLRISTQRLEAVLTLAHSLKEVKRADDITGLLKKIRKSLGPLRDAQVQKPVLKMIDGTKKMDTFFKKDKHHAHKKAKKALEEIHLKHERSLVDEISKEILAIESGKDKKVIQNQLDQYMKASVKKFNLLLNKVDVEKVKEIHNFRIFAKKLRYQAECLQDLNLKMPLSLKNLKDVQSIAGKVQNDTVLLKKLHQFLSKNKRKANPKVKKFFVKVNRHRAKLIKKDFSQLNSLKYVN